MAFNASDDGQTNTLILSTAHSNPTVPTDLQRASDHSLNGNADVSTTDFQQEKYEGLEWKRHLGHHIPHLTTGRRRGPVGPQAVEATSDKRDSTMRQEGVLTLCQDS